ncbi:MAG: hypothetical protein AAGK32_15020, partial [Actinomycetota bacterium]
MRRIAGAASILGLLVGSLLLFAPGAGAGDDDPGPGEPLPEVLDQATILFFLASIEQEFGVDDNGFPILPDDLDVLQGEAGDRDLPESDLLIATPEQQAAAAARIAAAGGEVDTSGSGSSLTGPCMGIAWSYREDGTPLYAAMDFDQARPPIEVYPDFGQVAFTEDNPYVVDVNGTVVYAGVAGGRDPGTGPRNHDWFIELEFAGVGNELDGGGDPNGDGENRNLGAVSLKEDLPGPAKVNAQVNISGRMQADAADEHERGTRAGEVEPAGEAHEAGPGALEAVVGLHAAADVD